MTRKVLSAVFILTLFSIPSVSPAAVELPCPEEERVRATVHPATGLTGLPPCASGITARGPVSAASHTSTALTPAPGTPVSVTEPVPVTPPSPPSLPSPGGNVLINPGFEDGLAGWETVSTGYGSVPGSKANTLGPDTSEGCLMLGAYGGYHWATQTVGATLGKGLKFNTRFKVQRWSTFGDRDGGWAAVSISFLDAGGNDLGSTRFYLNPFSTFEDRPHVRWIKLGTGTPVPTGWVDVSADVDALAEELGIKPADVTSVTVGLHVFGTHEDRTHTVACFDDFSLSGEGGGAVPDSDLDGVPDVWDKCPDTPPGSCINRQGCTAYGAQTGAPPPPITTYPPAPPAPPATAACTWDGKWNSNWGVLTLQSAGQGVTGGYEHDSGRINAAVSGNNITGTWSEAPSYAPPGDAGDLEFTMSADCRSFKGRWRYGSSGTWYTDWEGHRPTIGATGPLPGATGPLPRTTGPLPRTTGPFPRTTDD